MFKRNIEYVKEQFNKYGYDLLSTEYINRNTLLKYKCPEGHIGETRYRYFQQGCRCSKCADIKRINGITLTQKDVEETFKEHGCQLLSVYKLSNIPMEFICKCGKKYKKNLSNFKIAPHCGNCKLVKFKRHKRQDRDILKKELEIKRIVKGIMNRMLNGSKIQETTSKKIGYTTEEFIKHVSNFNLYNEGRNNFTIDHIFPYKAFFEHNIWDLKIINHLSNIQLLPLSENTSKNAKYNKQDFYNWLESIGYNDYEKQIQ